MMPMRALRRSLLLLPLLALSACNVVGQGNKLETLEIRDSVYGRTLPATLSMSQCLRYNVEALATFSDGSSGVYTSRVVWSSSDPTVLRVSNGDLALASDGTKFYAYGTLIPVGPGTATITANYVGKKANINVTVASGTPTITLVPYSTRLPRPAASAANLTIAPRTIQSYAALATLNGRVTDITGSAVWSVKNANKTGTVVGGTTCTNANAANLTCDPVELVTGSTSSFRAKRLDDATNPILPAGTTQNMIQADFNSLSGMASCPVVTATLNVANIDTTQNPPLTLSSEFDPNAPALIAGTTDRFKIIAKLAGGLTQDLSELGSSGDGTTAVSGFDGFPIQPTTDAAPNDASGRFKVVDSNNQPVNTFASGTKTITDCRTRDAAAFFSTSLPNLLYAVASNDGSVPDGTTRNVYASFLTIPPSATPTTATVTCPSTGTQVLATTSDAASVYSNVVTRPWRSGTLTAIALCTVGANTPVNSCTSPGSTTLTSPQSPQYAEDGARVQLRAIGTFTVNGGTATQDITRSVTWTSSDANTIAVVNGSLFPAQAGQAAASQPGSVTISASFTDPLTSVVTTAPSLTLTAN